MLILMRRNIKYSEILMQVLNKRTSYLNLMHLSEITFKIWCLSFFSLRSLIGVQLKEEREKVMKIFNHEFYLPPFFYITQTPLKKSVINFVYFIILSFENIIVVLIHYAILSNHFSRLKEISPFVLKRKIQMDSNYLLM